MPNLFHHQDVLPNPTLRTPFVRLKTCAGRPGRHTFRARGRFILRSDLARDFPSGSEPPGLAEGRGALHKADVFRGFAWEKKLAPFAGLRVKKSCTRTRQRSRSSQVIYWLLLELMCFICTCFYPTKWLERCAASTGSTPFRLSYWCKLWQTKTL